MRGDDSTEAMIDMKMRPETSNDNEANRPFREFVLSLKTADPFVRTFIDHATQSALPRLNSWSEVRIHLNGVGADQSAFIGARLAWREFTSAAKLTKRKAL
jgi:hypothetical protein